MGVEPERRRSWWNGIFLLTILATAANASRAITLPGEPQLLTASVVLLCLITWHRRSQGKRTAQSLGKCTGTLLILLYLAALATLVALPFANDAKGAVVDTGSFILFIVFMVGLVRVRWRDGVDSKDIQTISTSVGIVLLAGLIAHALGSPFTRSGYETNIDVASIGRYQGLLNNPNMAGLVGMVAAPLALGLCLSRRARINIIWLISAVLTVYMSGSRTSFYCLVAIGIIMMLRSRSRAVRVRAVWALGLVTSLALLAAILYSSSLEGWAGSRIWGGDEPGTGSTLLNNRVNAWNAGISLFSQSPVVGHGFGGAPRAMVELWQGGGSAFDRGSVHNAYIQWIVEVGILGVPVLATILVLFVKNLTVPHSTVMAQCLAWSTCAGLLANFTESALFGLGAPFAWVFWPLVAASAISFDRVPPPKNTLNARYQGRTWR